MSLPQTRQQLGDWCLRKLGAPVIQINIDEDQLEDRLDEALAYFRDYHFDGVERIWLKQKIEASVMSFASVAIGTFQANEVIVGQTSGARGGVVNEALDFLSLRFVTTVDSTVPFQDGEVVVGQTSGATATLAATNSILLGNLDKQYIDVDDSIVSVLNILPFSGGFGYSAGMFDLRYQFALNDMYNLLSTDLITYSMFKDNLALWSYLFQGQKGIRFNRKTNKIYLDIDWKRGLNVDQYIILECWKSLDPETYKEIYSDFFVREYATALIKKQWGQNLKKYSGIAMPGGVTFNGQTLYDEAMAELEVLERRIQREFQLPPDFYMG